MKPSIMKKILPLAFCVFCALTSVSQNSQDLYMNKVNSLDSIIGTLYSVISGEKTDKRNWDLFRHLFKGNANLITYIPEDKSLLYSSVDEYINSVEDYFGKVDFFERETNRVVDSHGPIVHVFSTYETFNGKSEKSPIIIGINSIQLLNDGNRWWILNVYWTDEANKYHIAPKYLPKN